MKRGSILTVLLVLVLAVAGCGGDSSSTGGSTSDTGSTEESTSTTATDSEATATDTDSGPTGPEDIPKRGKPKVEPNSDPAPTKLEVDDLIEGTGAVAASGDKLTMQYIGTGYQSGTEFDSSWERQPFIFELGSGKGLAGLEKGIVGMRVGGRRELIIPPDLAYGKKGTEVIAPNATVVFVIDLLSVESEPPRSPPPGDATGPDGDG